MTKAVKQTLLAASIAVAMSGAVTRATPDAGLQYRDFAIAEGSIDIEARTVELSFASEMPVQRWWGDEVLEISASAMRMSRLQNGAALLVDHDTTDQVGVIVRAWIDGKVARAIVRFGRSARAEEIFMDVQDGIRKLVSVGYRINEYVLQSKSDAGETYRITDWEPFEISLVSVPADASVGVGRDLEHPLKRASQKPGAAGNHHHQERNMPPEIEQVVPPVVVAPTVRAEDILASERTRTQDITTLGKLYGLGDEAERAIKSGTSIDAFRATVLDKLKPSPSATPAESRDIGMSTGDVQRFSLCRALLVASDPQNQSFRKAAAFELEASEAARNKRGDMPDATRKLREDGITIPPEVLRAGLSASGAQAQAIMHMARNGGDKSALYRDLVVGTSTAGGHTVATELLSGSFIDLLRARARVMQMGATVLGDLSGNIAIPRQTGGASCYWVAESGVPTESQPSFDQVSMTPKTVGTYTDFSRRLLLQSSLDVEAFVRAELAITLAIYGIDYAALNGSGSSNEPTGLFNASGVGAVVMGTNGTALTWAKVVEFETAIANANADVGTMAYLSNSKVRGSLKTIEKFSGSGKEIWQPGRDPRNGIGEVNGYDAYVSNNVSSAYTKGSSSGVCSGVAFGNWADLFIGMWGGLDLLLDPYSAATSGGKRVVALQDCDIAVRRGGSFAVSKDVLTA
jgi:HK97 family phage major capsid protein